MKKSLGRQCPVKKEDEIRTRFPKPKWDTDTKRGYLMRTFMQPMRFKDERLDVREATNKKVEEIFSFFFHGVK